MWGGQGNKLNILDESGPLTKDGVLRLYRGYNPEGAYIQSLIRVLFE